MHELRKAFTVYDRSMYQYLSIKSSDRTKTPTHPHSLTHTTTTVTLAAHMR